MTAAGRAGIVHEPAETRWTPSSWRVGRYAPHGPEHDCFSCALMRAVLDSDPLPITIGGVTLPALKVGEDRQ